MPRHKNDYALAAAALRDINKLENTAPAKKRCPPGFTLSPYGELIPKKKTTISQLVALDREKRTKAGITLAPVTMGDVTDADIGLPDDPVAQLRAETYLRAVIAYRQREDERARQLARAAALAVPQNVPVVRVEVPDESMALIDPTDRLSPEDAAILAELRRIAGRHRVDDRGPAVT